MMSFKVLNDVTRETPEGLITLRQGQVIRLITAEAIPLIQAGFITPVERAAYRIYSEILQAHLWVVETDSDMHSLRAEGIPEAIYTGEEIRKLGTSGMDKEGLKAVHSVKQTFEKSQVTEAGRKGYKR